MPFLVKIIKKLKFSNFLETNFSNNQKSEMQKNIKKHDILAFLTKKSKNN